MKKTYINPELEIIRLQTMQMLADSVVLYNDEGLGIDDENPVDNPNKVR
jgi:hypothetical protein